MGLKPNAYAKPFFIRKTSIPLWSISVLIPIILVFFFGKYFAISDEKQAISFLNVNAELLVTILAVTMSFTLLGLQFLAESYTPRALGRYLKDKIIYGFPILYITLISLNLISSAFPLILPPIQFLQFSVIGTIFSLVYLIGFIYYVVGKIQPERVIVETSKNILPDTWKEIVKTKGSLDISFAVFRPFIILEQTMIKAVNNNDIFSYVQGLKILFDLLEKYLDEIHKEFLIHKQPAKHGWESDYVYSFFFRIFSQLFAESITHSREQFIIGYQWHLFHTFTKLYEYRHTRALDDFWEQIDYLGQKVFNLEMISAADSFIQHMDELAKLEFKIVKQTREDWPKDPMGYRQKSHDDFAIEELSHDFRYDRIESLTKFTIISAEKKIEKLVSRASWILRDILSDSLTLKDGITRRGMVYTVTESMKKIHEASVNHGINNTYTTTHWIENYLKKLDKRYADEAKDLVEKFCKMSLYSIEYQNYFEIHQLGISCRQLAEDYPNLVIILLDALDKSYTILEAARDPEIREKWKKETVKEIESAEKWNKNHHAMITTKVVEILQSKSVEQNTKKSTII